MLKNSEVPNKFVRGGPLFKFYTANVTGVPPFHTDDKLTNISGVAFFY